jgi:autotransporter-associated beta strand protein
LSGGGGLTKAGSGGLTLARSAGNSYTGATTVAAGTILVMNSTGSATGTGTVTINAGAVLGGSGTSQGNIVNNGTVAPGNAIGTLHLGGNYTQGVGGKLEIELASTANHDELAVGSTASLAGSLAVSLINGFMPQAGDVFELMSASGFGGSKFANTILPALAGGLAWNINYNTSSVTLSVALAGDFDGSGTVDAADYVFWRKRLGTTYNSADYDLWRANFGRFQGGAGSSLVAVPEPSALVLLLIIIFSFAYCRCRSTQA